MPKKKDASDQAKDASAAPAAAEPVNEKAGILTRIKAAVTTGFCEFCQAARLIDEKGIHLCARCRRETIVPAEAPPVA